ncbi:MAG: AraC family transcriptional regulator [Clostridia bacterium]|nr:AraC family transcriptional regulator [Clostridia bacterium]
MFDSTLKFVVDQIYEKDYAISLHDHPCYEIVYYLSGSGTTEIGGKRYAFRPDRFIIVEPKMLHGERGGAGVEVLYIGFETAGEQLLMPSGIYQNEDFPILDDLKEIAAEMENKRAYYARVMNLLTERLVIKLGRLNAPQQAEHKDFEYIRNFIKLNCMKRIDVMELAKTFGYSYDHFRRLFQARFGISAKDYLLQEKLRYATDLLENGDLSIKKVAEMTNFASTSHFCTVFRRYTGMSPKQYLILCTTGQNHREISSYLDEHNMPTAIKKI